jgi:hypothetical protein
MRRFLERLLGIILVWILFSAVFIGIGLLINFLWNVWPGLSHFGDEPYYY